MENQPLKPDNTHFNKIFWFIVGICTFSAVLTIFLIIYLPEKAAERIADSSIMFWLSTGASGGIGYLIGASFQKPNTAKPGEATAEISATFKSVSEESKE